MYFLLTCQHSRFMKCFIHFALQGIMWMWIWLIGMMIWMMCIWEWYELFNDVDMECKSKSIKNTVSQVIFCYLRVCVYLYSFTVKASSNCKMSKTYFEGTDQRSCVVNISWVLSAKFLHLHIWKCHISPPKTKTPANSLLERKRYDIMCSMKRWYILSVWICKCSWN